jgi:hypothetical protein
MWLGCSNNLGSVRAEAWPKSERREITGANGGPMEFNVDDRTNLLDRINRIATQGAARDVHAPTLAAHRLSA